MKVSSAREAGGDSPVALAYGLLVVLPALLVVLPAGLSSSPSLVEVEMDVSAREAGVDSLVALACNPVPTPELHHSKRLSE